MTGAAALHAHLAQGVTTVCNAWAVTRADGVTLGFTDHDRDLAFDGLVFRAGTGLSARVLQAGTGLSVDNSEALGALSDAAITEDDFAAGLYDGARVTSWRVNWADVTAREVQFAGTIGDITRAAGGFRAELRGLAEALGRATGRIYQPGCAATLGDARCGVDLTAPAYRSTATVTGRDAAGRLMVEGAGGFPDGWFSAGQLLPPGGTRAGFIKDDRLVGGQRQIELWSGAAQIAAGPVTLIAGCDKRAATCRAKFANFLNFRGFPHIPGEDWLASYPVAGGTHDGGKLK